MCIQFVPENTFLCWPVLWIEIYRIGIRIQNFRPIWIRIQGYDTNLEKVKNNFREKQFDFKKSFLNNKKIMAPKELFSKLSL